MRYKTSVKTRGILFFSIRDRSDISEPISRGCINITITRFQLQL